MGRGPDWRTPVQVAAVAAVVVAVLALLANVGPTGVTAPRLSAAIGEEFNNVTLLQQQLIGRRAPAGARLDVLPNCNRHAAKATGPGDWNCSLNVYLPQAHSVPFSATSVEYDVSVDPTEAHRADVEFTTSPLEAPSPNNEPPLRRALYRECVQSCLPGRRG